MSNGVLIVRHIINHHHHHHHLVAWTAPQRSKICCQRGRSSIVNLGKAWLEHFRNLEPTRNTIWRGEEAGRRPHCGPAVKPTSHVSTGVGLCTLFVGLRVCDGRGRLAIHSASAAARHEIAQGYLHTCPHVHKHCGPAVASSRTQALGALGRRPRLDRRLGQLEEGRAVRRDRLRGRVLASRAAGRGVHPQVPDVEFGRGRLRRAGSGMTDGLARLEG